MWVPSPLREQAYFTDGDYLKRLGIELRAPVSVENVIPFMGTAVFNPVLVRPLFEHLGLVTCRTFETPAANTIPLFAQNSTYITEIYGEGAAELIMREGQAGSEQILDVMHHPNLYAKIVHDIRRHLTEKHSYASRFEELLAIITE